MPARRFLLSCAVCLVLVIAGCADDSSSSITSASSSAAREEAKVTDEDWPEGEVGSKVSVPEGPPPNELVIKDLVRGSGPPAKLGDEVEFQYVEALYSTGEVISVAVPGAPFHVQLDSPGSLPGREKGIVGMRVGGRRELIIPPHLAYGKEKSLSVPPNSTLLLRVNLVGIR